MKAPVVQFCMGICPGEVFVYDESGLLLGEYSTDGSARQEHIWVDDAPVAVVQATKNEVLYVHADYLNTPRALSDGKGHLRWRWVFEGNAFGELAAESDPAATGEPVEYNLRYPGQYFDVESGLHYNYFRDYEPATGRYVQSDPIGLGGGLSTYSYGEQDPYSTFDPKGLSAQTASDSECCAWMRNRVSADAEGTVVCCNGRKILCTWDPLGGAPPVSIINKCRRMHEESHMSDGKCQPGCPADFGVPNRAASECTAYAAEIRCLRARKSDCKSSATCKRTIEAEIADREGHMTQWCGRAMGPPEP